VRAGSREGSLAVSGIAIVTGAANGIGRAVALRLAAAGFAIELVDLETGVENVRAEIISGGGKAEVHVMDATNAEQVKSMVASVTVRQQRIDALANIAGGPVYLKAAEELSWEEWKEDLDRNLKGTFLFCREVAPVMMRQGSGRIVNTSSNYGLTGSALRTPYSAAKAAIIGFSKSLALELGPSGVLVNIIAPGPTDTPRVLEKSTPAARQRWTELIPLGRTAQPDEIAEGVAFLVGPESGYMAGQTLHVNGGLVM
jgi:NAD(P)-dependent dehydrogenase (short-subunit alcohol dehydrogenase family)